MLNRLSRGLRPFLLALPLLVASGCAPRTAEAPRAAAAAIPGMVSAADPRAAGGGG